MMDFGSSLNSLRAHLYVGEAHHNKRALRGAFHADPSHREDGKFHLQGILRMVAISPYLQRKEVMRNVNLSLLS